MCGTAVSPVKDDDKCKAHAACRVESEAFGVLDCGASTSFGSVEGAGALFSKSHENDTPIPEVDPFGGRSFNFGDGASSKATSLSRLPVRMVLLVTSGSLCICSWISQNRETGSTDARYGFSQGTALRHRLW